jgi:selenocysteine lyase/cysteine desulfurase
MGVHFYNTREEIERALRVLDECTPSGSRAPVA